MAFDGTLKFDTAIDKSGFETGLSALGGLAKKGMAAITGSVTAAAGGVAMFAKSSLEAYASYEQLVGGTELLFGEAYDYIVDKAKEAYKTVQMSQNDYLQQVNGFSTGLKTALGGNIQAAAELADRIVNAEADVVAATGVTQEAVQNAFNGIMKSNYTMLDNLQLGISPTKQGFEELIDKVNEWNAANGEATAYQIDNLADCESALVDYIEMQGLAGYAANEAADTIEGSVSAMKAAWANLTVEIAKDDADIDGSISALTESLQSVLGNIIPRAEQVLSGIGSLVASVAPIIADEIPKLVSAVLPPLLTAATGVINGLSTSIREALPSVAESIVSALPDVISAAETLFSGILEGLVSVAETVVPMIPDIVATLGAALSETAPLLVSSISQLVQILAAGIADTLPVLIDAALGLISALGNAFLDNIPVILPVLYELVESVINTLADGIPKVLDVAEQLITKGAAEILPQVVTIIGTQVPKIIAALSKALPQIERAVSKVIPELAKTIVSAAPVIVQAITDVMPNVIETAVSALTEMYPAVHEALVTLITSLADLLPVIQETCYDMMPPLYEALADVLIDIAPDLLELAVGLAVSVIRSTGEIVISLIWNLLKTIGQTLADIGDILSDVIVMAKEKAVSGAQDIIDRVMEWLDVLPGRMSVALGNALGEIAKFAVEAPEKAGKAAGEIVKKVGEFIRELPSTIGEWLGKAVTTVKEWGPKLVSHGKEAALDLVNNIGRIIAELPSKMAEAGGNLVRGLWNGITGMGGWIQDKISDFGDGIIKGFKESFEIASPSKVMRDQVGRYLAEGIGVGFAENMPDLASMAHEAIDDIKIDIPDIKLPDDSNDRKPPRIPRIDSTAYQALGGIGSLDRNIAPTSTTEIINNYSYSTTSTPNNSTAPEPVPTNITFNATFKVGEEVVAEGVVDIAADKIDERQGVTVELKKRGLAR